MSADQLGIVKRIISNSKLIYPEPHNSGAFARGAKGLIV